MGANVSCRQLERAAALAALDGPRSLDYPRRRDSFVNSALTGSVSTVLPLTPLATTGSPLSLLASPAAVAPAATEFCSVTGSTWRTIASTFAASSTSS
jgi:hypothetical protein